MLNKNHDPLCLCNDCINGAYKSAGISPPSGIFSKRVSGSGTTGDEFKFIDTVPLSDYKKLQKENLMLRHALDQAHWGSEV